MTLETKTLSQRTDDALRDARHAFYADEHDRMAQSLDEAWALALADGSSLLCARTAHTASDLFNRSGQQKRAWDAARLALEHKRHEGAADIMLANYLCFLAKLLLDLGQHSEGLVYAEEGLVIFAEIYGEEHRETRLVRTLLHRLQSE